MAPFLLSCPPDIFPVLSRLTTRSLHPGSPLALFKCPNRNRFSNDQATVHCPEIPAIERVGMTVQEQDFVIGKHFAAAPGWQFSALSILKFGHCEGYTRDKNMSFNAANFIARHCGDTLENWQAWRKITPFYGDPAQRWRKPYKGEVALFHVAQLDAIEAKGGAG